MLTSAHVTLTVAPEDLSEFLTHLKPMLKIVAAEPENASLAMFISQETPGVVRLVESWTKDRKWLEEVRRPYGVMRAGMCVQGWN